MKNSFSPGASLSRRNFLAISGVIPAAIAVQFSISGSAAEPATPEPAGAKKDPIGLELYSVRGELGRDLPNTLKTVAKFGYEVVEFYSPYFKWTPPYTKDVRAQMDDLGLRCYSTHNGFESFTPGEKIAHAIELNQILGTRYVVLASAPGRNSGVDGWKKLCEQLTAAVEQLKTHGLSAGYHNHQAEWSKLEAGQRIIEVIAAIRLRNSCCSWMSALARKSAPTRSPGSKLIPDASRSCISKIGRQARTRKKKGIASCSARASRHGRSFSPRRNPSV